MAFRERAVWVALVVHLGLFALCGLAVFGALRSGAADWIVLANLPIVAFLLTMFLSRSMIEMITRRVPGTDPRLPPDERDRAIEARSASLAYRVILFGMLVIGSLTLRLFAETAPFGPFGQTSETLASARELSVVALNLIYFSVAAAELTRWTTQLILYRRQG